jgi:hypothetical protein
MENHTAKHFVLQLGSLITLYLSLGFLIALVFSTITIFYPDAAAGSWEAESASQSVRLSIAMLVVFFPTYLYLTRKVNLQRRESGSDAYTGLTKWLVYLSLLVGGGVLLGDMVAILLAFLNGELTSRFILKALFLLVLVGSAFYYYLKDARGYWNTREKASIMFGAGMALVVVASIIVGLMNIESPAVVREVKLDNAQITDLQQIQWRIQDKLAVSSTTLPSTLEEIYVEFEAPTAPEGREAYSYELTETGFKLCATFAGESSDINQSYPNYGYEKGMYMTIVNPDDWAHKAGRYCFERVVK